VRDPALVVAISPNATLPVSGTITANQGTPTPWTQNLTQVGGAALALGQAAMAASLPVALASNQGAVATLDAASSATGSAVPAKALFLGSEGSGNLNGIIGCDSSVIYDASTSGSTQLVGLVSGKIIYVCGYGVFAAGTVNVELDYGTGSACVTGTQKIVPAFQLIAQTGVVDPSPFYRGLKTIASNELCIKTSAGIAVQAIVYYSQF
jgi:hypothetical protein